MHEENVLVLGRDDAAEARAGRGGSGKRHPLRDRPRPVPVMKSAPVERCLTECDTEPIKALKGMIGRAVDGWIRTSARLFHLTSSASARCG
jgi:hypothetical protein